jgi:hypothetical protein
MNISDNALSPITHLIEKSSVRTVEVDGCRLVSANDVMKALDYPTPKDAWFKLRPTVEKYAGQVASHSTWVNGRIYEMDYLNLKQFITLCLKSTKQKALPFFQWGVAVLEQEIISKVSQDYNDRLFDLSPASESSISDQLAHLCSRTSSRWIFEKSVIDSLRPNWENGNPKVRRFDAYQKTGRLVKLLELKKGTLTSKLIDDVINDRAYLEICADLAPGKFIDLIFCCPSIDASAQRALERLEAQDQYKTFNVAGHSFKAKIRWISLTEFGDSIAEKIIKETPLSDRWEKVQNLILPCRQVLSQKLVEDLLNLYPKRTSNNVISINENIPA